MVVRTEVDSMVDDMMMMRNFLLWRWGGVYKEGWFGEFWWDDYENIIMWNKGGGGRERKLGDDSGKYGGEKKREEEKRGCGSS